MTTLAELRQANLKEQNSPHTKAETPAALPEQTHAEAASPAPVSPANASAAATAADLSPALRLSVAPAPPTEDMRRDTAFLARIREALSRKVIHPTGAKATVDMAPALFHRAKHYCNQRGNISLRQVFLELLTVFLDEEGY